MKRKLKGFTLVELVITIAIVIILSVISVPIYRGYIDKAKWAEGYALAGTILSAQKSYYSEYGNFYCIPDSNTWSNFLTSYVSDLGIDARGNKYFTYFIPGDVGQGPSIRFISHIKIPQSEVNSDKKYLRLAYNITVGIYKHSDDVNYLNIL